MPGLIRASIALRKSPAKRMDCRVKPGNDENECAAADLALDAVIMA
jgi:hypothetical protein